MSYKDSNIIIYVQRPSSKKSVRKIIDCRNCTRCNVEERTCKKRKDIYFYEGSGCGCYWGYYKNCKFFNPRNNLDETQQEKARKIVNKNKIRKENGKNKASKNSLNSDNESVDRFNGNRRTIYKACQDRLLDDYNLMFLDIAANNNVELWDKKGEKQVCDCGGKMKFLPDIEVKFHAGKELVSVLITGKKCLKCNRIFLVKDIVIDCIKEIKEEITYKKAVDTKYTVNGYQMRLTDLIK